MGLSFVVPERDDVIVYFWESGSHCFCFFVFLFFSALGHCEPPADSSVFQHFVKHFVLWLQREEKTQFLRPGWQLSNILQVNTAAIETAYMNSQAQFDTKSVSLLVLPYTQSLSVIMYRSITLTSLCPPEVSRCIYSLNSRTVLIMFAWFIVEAFWMQSAGKHASLCSLFNIWNILLNTPTNQYIRTVFVGQKKLTSVWWREVNISESRSSLLWGNSAMLLYNCML